MRVLNAEVKAELPTSEFNSEPANSEFTSAFSTQHSALPQSPPLRRQ
jgi:hypothetical protein